MDEAWKGDVNIEQDHSLLNKWCNLMDDSLPVSSCPSQERILEWVAISFSRGSSQPRDWTYISCTSCIAGGFFTNWATREALKWLLKVDHNRPQSLPPAHWDHKFPELCTTMEKLVFILFKFAGKRYKPQEEVNHPQWSQLLAPFSLSTKYLNKRIQGIPRVVQWVRIHYFHCGDPGLIPG